MAKSVAIYNFKGGVGKTTTAINLAFSWGRSFKVLLIDCDPQTNLTSALTGRDGFEHSIFHFIKTCLHGNSDKLNVIEINPYIHLIPGDLKMLELDSNNQFITFGQSIIYRLFQSLKWHYDIIILDCPSYFGISVKSFLSNTNSILIPAVPDSFSISGINKLLLYLKSIERAKQLEILGVFFNRFRKHTLYHKEVISSAKKNFGSLILDNTIRNSIKVSEAVNVGESIWRLNPDCDVALDFLELSDVLIGRFNTQTIDRIEVNEEII